MPFSRELYIEQDDFRDPAPPKYFRLSPGAEVRLRYAYIVKCTGVTRDAAGQVTEVRCTYDPDSRGGDSKGRKVKGTIHWVSAAHAVDAEVRLYDTLFTVPKPDDAEDYRERAEPALAGGARPAPRSSRRWPAWRRRRACSSSAPATSSSDWQRPHARRRPVFNRAVGLRDTWAKIESKG